jgi:hypothetical protein
MASNDIESPLRDLMIQGLELPAELFSRPFKQYFFFDADISSSAAMISAVQDAVVSCFNRDHEVQVFSSSNGHLVGRLDRRIDWSIGICLLGKKIRESGDVGGVALVDESLRWIAYQRRPVDIGIFAIDCDVEIRSIPSVADSFFDRSDILGWLDGKSQRDIDLVGSFGREFLVRLAENYN